MTVAAKARRRGMNERILNRWWLGYWMSSFCDDKRLVVIWMWEDGRGNPVQFIDQQLSLGRLLSPIETPS
jgi:hypothetical protein